VRFFPIMIETASIVGAYDPVLPGKPPGTVLPTQPLHSSVLAFKSVLVGGIIMFTEDITQRKKTEEEPCGH